MTIRVARRLGEQIRPESGAAVELVYYDAGHAFMNPDDEMGARKPELAELARARTLKFPASTVR